ncbi:hypothetical protein CLIB1423_01S01508 [[Candida] railenensis]|uniref:Spc7 kinetochore protein domain-containing protein n=1 Tax=[Candida] railenensis TaxID=45579 RepID=A0A9P0QK09_9ASCO|nr:hypothetical protein CLIB1423_01S01508 [[Candida] railenensis]
MEGQENEPEITENLSKPILKSNFHNGLSIPLNDESNTISRSTAKLPRRRVSFAPEVTLHKIDFVPQYRSDSFESDTAVTSQHQRRETIAFIPSSSDISSNETNSSQDSDEKRDVGVDVLQDSSEEENEEEEGEVSVKKHPFAAVSGEEQASGDEDDSAPIQSAIPIPSTLPYDTDEELTMEITEPIQIQKQTIDLHVREAQDQSHHTSRVEIPLDEMSSDDDEISDNKDEDEGEMELTVNVGRQTLAASNRESFSESKEKVGQIHALTELGSSGDAEKESITDEVDMELTQAIGHSSIKQMQSSADEVTQSKGKTSVEQIKLMEEHSEIYHDSLDDLFEEKSMEITQQISSIEKEKEKEETQISYISEIQFPVLLQKNVQENENEGKEMEFQQPLKTLSGNNAEDIDKQGKPEEFYSEEEGEDEEYDEAVEMEFTQQVGNIKSKSDKDLKNEDPMEESDEKPEEASVQGQTHESADSDMELTQQVSKVNTPAHGEYSKRKAEEDISNDSQPQKIFHSATTSTIPLADVTYDSIDENSEIFNLVTLNQFMIDIGIKFYDDLEIGSQSQNRISISLPKVKLDGESEFGLEDYVMGAIKIPVYELNEFSCKELLQNIQEGIKIFETINESTSSMNPRLFKEFYETIPEAKLSMKTEFQLIKDYSRQEAKKVWYGWRSQLIRNVLDELTKTIENLKEDRSKLLLGIEQINEANDIVFNRHRQLKLKLANFKQLVASSESIDKKDLHDFQIEMKQIQEHIGQFRREYAQQTLNLRELNQAILEKEKTISILNAEIRSNTDIIQRNKKYDATEINLLIYKFNLLETLTKSRIIKNTEVHGKKLVFEFDSSITIIMDFNDMRRGFSYEFKEKSPTFKIQDLYLAHSQNLNVMFQDDNHDKLNILEQFRSLRMIWQNLQKIDFLLYKISLKFPVKIDKNNGDIIIKYYIAEFKCKFELRLEVDVRMLLVKKFNIKILRMGELVDTQIVLGNFKRECCNNDLVKGIETASWE